MKKESPCHKCGCVGDRSICSEKCQLLAEYRKTLKNDGDWPGISTLRPPGNHCGRRIMPIREFIDEDEIP